LVATFPGFSKNYFEEPKLSACCFSKEFCANPRSLSTNCRRGTALFYLQKNFVNSKRFGVKRAKKLIIQYNTNGRVAKIMNSWRILS
jgi:hypothetical protein